MKTIWFFLLPQKPYLFSLSRFFLPTSSTFLVNQSPWNQISLLPSKSVLCNLKCVCDHYIFLKAPWKLLKAFKLCIMTREESPFLEFVTMTTAHKLLVWTHEKPTELLITSCYYMTLSICLEYPFFANLANFLSSCITSLKNLSCKLSHWIIHYLQGMLHNKKRYCKEEPEHCNKE